MLHVVVLFEGRPIMSRRNFGAQTIHFTNASCHMSASSSSSKWTFRSTRYGIDVHAFARTSKYDKISGRPGNVIE